MSWTYLPDVLPDFSLSAERPAASFADISQEGASDASFGSEDHLSLDPPKEGSLDTQIARASRLLNRYDLSDPAYNHVMDIADSALESFKHYAPASVFADYDRRLNPAPVLPAPSFAPDPAFRLAA